MEVVKAPTGQLAIILSKEEQKILMQTLMGGVQEEIKFDETPLNEDPFKNFKKNTKDALVELVKTFKCSPFTGHQTTDIRRKYYVPDIQNTLRLLSQRGHMTIERKSDNVNVYQFNERLCRHFGN
jgi:hypothetical protein